jgi:SAM-dependent methyltransferase
MPDWEQYAKQNAEFFILTRPEVDYSTPGGRASFFRSGEQESARLLKRIESLLPGHDRCVDFGCGIGRLALPHAGLFQEVYAVDISPTMLAKLKLTCQQKEIQNIRPFLVSDAWDEEGTADYVYSIAVFQHIPEFSVIADHLRRIRRILKPTGIAQLHFDTRPPNLFYHMRNLLPDVLLPSVYWRGLRRIRRSPVDLVKAFSNLGLKVVEESGIADDQTVYVLTPR